MKKKKSIVDNRRRTKNFEEGWWCLKTLLQHLSRVQCDQNIIVHVAHVDLHDLLYKLHHVMTQGVCYL
jgi:hypothetical protein